MFNFALRVYDQCGLGVEAEKDRNGSVGWERVRVSDCRLLREIARENRKAYLWH